MAPNERELRSQIRSLLNEQDVPPMPEPAGEAIRQIILSTETERAKQPALIARFNFLQKGWLRYAAAIIILFATGAYLYTTQNKKKTPAVAQTNTLPVQNDVMPGSEKAVLTLSSGRQIELIADSGQNITDGALTIRNGRGKLTYSRSEIVVSNTITTPKGGQYLLVLADGTKVWLNAASSITYPTGFSGKDRTVKVTGETYFEVAKNTRQPFHVLMNGVAIEVLGTHFNINAYGDESKVSTTLLEGSVLVRNGIVIEKLKPGQQARVSREGNLDILSNVNTDAVMAWKNGYIQFDNHSIQTNLRQLGRWYNLQVVVTGKMPSLQLVGKMNKQVPLSDVLAVFGRMGLKTRLEPGNKLIIIGQ